MQKQKNRTKQLIDFTTSNTDLFNDHEFKLGAILLGCLSLYKFLLILVNEQHCHIECFDKKGFRVHSIENINYRLDELLELLGSFIELEIMKVSEVSTKGTTKIFKIS